MWCVSCWCFDPVLRAVTWQHISRLTPAGVQSSGRWQCRPCSAEWTLSLCFYAVHFFFLFLCVVYFWRQSRCQEFSRHVNAEHSQELNVVALCCTALQYVALCLGDIFHIISLYSSVPLQFGWLSDLRLLWSALQRWWFLRFEFWPHGTGDHQFATLHSGIVGVQHHSNIQWIGLRENLQENPIFNGEIYGFL